ncbi:MAG TPA: hypothetical protein VFT22_07575 [Kofleriaceae bacterium]|nr:hypothetical protein [Kofleriaceae bacterium]
MISRTRCLIKSRTIRTQAWWLAMHVSVHGWRATDMLVVAGIAEAWRECHGVMGVS